MKRKIDNYIFDPANRTIVLPDFSDSMLDLSGLLMITNITDNIRLYNCALPASHASVDGNIITLSYDTTSMDAADVLQIFYEDGIDEQKITVTTMLKNILMALLSLPFVDKSLNRVRATAILESGSVTLSGTNNIATVAALTNVDGYQGKTLMINMSTMAWADVVRRTIS